MPPPRNNYGLGGSLAEIGRVLFERFGTGSPDQSGTVASSGTESYVSQSGQTGSGDVPENIKTYINLRVEQMMREVDNRFSPIENKLEKIPTLWQIVAVVGSIVGAGVAVIIATMAFGGDRYDVGLSTGSQFSSEIKENREAVSDLQKGQTEILRLLESQLETENNTEENPETDEKSD